LAETEDIRLSYFCPKILTRIELIAVLIPSLLYVLQLKVDAFVNEALINSAT